MRSLGICGIVLMLLALSAPGQDAPPPEKVERYDVEKEVTVKGTATEIKDYVCPVSGTVGTHIVLKTAEGNVEAHVASAKFLPEYGIQLAVGDELEILGMKTKVAGKDALLVRRIQHGPEIFTFRDKKGRPIW